MKQIPERMKFDFPKEGLLRLILLRQ